MEIRKIGLTTKELAAALGLKPQTLRTAHCLHGNYMGLRPKKLPNRRLVWPADSLERIMEGAEQ